MKNTMLRSLSLLGISLMMALSVAAQDDAKVKTSDKENKYKSDELKMKDKKDESKYKSAGVKIKDKKDERKVKANVKPMRPTSTARTEIKTGETQVTAREHVNLVNAAPPVPEPVATDQLAVPETPVPVKKVAMHHKRPAIHKTNTAHKYIVRTKVVRDTVFVPERIVSVDTEYVRDTVSVTRVDTVLKNETRNTYSGYYVPKGKFKKVKLKKDKDSDNDEVRMKTK